MSAPVLLIRSHHGPLPIQLAPYVQTGQVEFVWDQDLTDAHVDAAHAIITTHFLDQIAMMPLAPAFDRLMERGGRIVLQGHVSRPFVAGLAPFVVSGTGRRADFVLTVLDDHAIFAGIDRLSLETRRGVAGFYGRGHNPPPEKARILTGVGAKHRPIDWTWRSPRGGAIFCHSGHDLWITSDDPIVMQRVTDNMMRWCMDEGHTDRDTAE